VVFGSRNDLEDLGKVAGISNHCSPSMESKGRPSRASSQSCIN
jgi:hypothetical protein